MSLLKKDWERIAGEPIEFKASDASIDAVTSWDGLLNLLHHHKGMSPDRLYVKGLDDGRWLFSLKLVP